MPTVQVTLPPDTESPRRARRFVEEFLVEGAMEDISDLAALLVSEVVTNAILHAHSEVTVRIDREGRGVHIEVADASPVPPTRRAVSDESATGRGMILVEELSDAWGLERSGVGKVVWFDLGVAA